MKLTSCKLFLVAALTVSTFATPLHAEMREPKGLSGMSVLGSVVVVGGSAILILSPVLIVSQVIADGANNSGKVNLRVTTDKGQDGTIELPQETVSKLNIQPGDRLAVKPNASGALLSKGEQPVAFLVGPENANLTRNHELAH